MAVSFASYEIARSGLYVNERGLNVTGHNISNVNTPGYVRQQAMITTGSYQNENKYQLGLGADIEQIRQIRHSFLDNMYRQENTTLGYWGARNKTFQDVQAILGEPMGAGFQNTMNQFWDSWQELSKDPDSLTVRALVRQRGEALVHQINHMGSQLDKLQNDINSEISVRIDEVNQITGQIANLNTEIMKVEVSKDTANDYRDQRNTLVDRLSKLVGAEINEMQDGQMDVTLGGHFLVSKGIQTKIYAAESEKGGLFYVPKIVGTDIEIPLKNGTIKGLMESRGEVLGSVGSIQNGTPNTKADIVLAVDNSNRSGANLENIKQQINKYVDDLNARGIDYNIRLVTYGANAALDTTVYSSSNMAAFKSKIAGLAEQTSDDANDFSKVVDTISTGINFRDGSDRQAFVFTGEGISGQEHDVDNTEAASLADKLKNAGIRTSVVTDSAYFSSGDTAGGWDKITGATNGKTYALNTDYSVLMNNIATDMSSGTNPVDINFVIDNSNGSGANLADVKASVLDYVNRLNKQGIDYNLRLITYDAAASFNNTVYDKNSYNDFVTAVNGITENAASEDNNFSAAVNQLNAISTSASPFRSGADKYAIVFTNESVGGNGGAISDPSADISTLNTLGIKTSIATNSYFINNGDPGGESGWSSIASATGGSTYATDTDMGKLMVNICEDTKGSVNQAISTAPESSNIISDLKKKLNAIISVMVREVNYMQKSGKNLLGAQGDDFFKPINGAYPMEMGNLKLNDNLSNMNGLNNIVASASGDNGDNTIALQIANLRHQSLMNDSKDILSIDDYYQSIILSVGNNGADADRISANQQKLVDSSDAYRQSITGVSMDEEMTNMMKYKFAYDASSRVINAVDEMINTIISSMGTVGR